MVSTTTYNNIYRKNRYTHFLGLYLYCSHWKIWSLILRRAFAFLLKLLRTLDCVLIWANHIIYSVQNSFFVSSVLLTFWSLNHLFWMIALFFVCLSSSAPFYPHDIIIPWLQRLGECEVKIFRKWAENSSGCKMDEYHSTLNCVAQIHPPLYLQKTAIFTFLELRCWYFALRIKYTSFSCVVIRGWYSERCDTN